MSIKVSKIGSSGGSDPWKAVREFMKNFGAEIEAGAQEGLKKIALKGEGLAKKHISNQDLGWQPLKAATIAAKIRKGHSENILVDSSTMFQSITSWVADNTAYSGVHKKVFYKDADNKEVEVANIAELMEYGSLSGSIPARPLWKPVLKELRVWVKSGQPIQKSIANRLKKYTKK